MLGLLFVKWLSTALVVVGVSMAVVRLGPRLGGVLAGTPIVLGPGYFFMLCEQPPAFVAEAALGSLHAMPATLTFCLCSGQPIPDSNLSFASAIIGDTPSLKV